MRRTAGLVLIAARVAGAEPPAAVEPLQLRLSPDLFAEHDDMEVSGTAGDWIDWHIETRLERKLGHGLELRETGESDPELGYTDLELAIAKVLQLPDGNTAWISLGVGAHSWAHEPTGGVVMVRAGFTFR
ncbi:MAG TPA: hypothetical protein VGL61_29530 [Kofleriaceae bacterium]|jgi:hypothetical protein